MALGNLSLTPKSRGKGKCAAGELSYISRSKLNDVTTGLTFSSRERKDLVWNEVFLPNGANPEWSDMQKLADAVEEYTSNANAQICDTYIGWVPNELSDESIIRIGQELGQHFAEQGIVNAIAFHNETKKGQLNKHLHGFNAIRECENGKFVASSLKAYRCRCNGEDVWLTSKQLNFRKGTDQEAEKIYKYIPKGEEPSEENTIYLTRSEYAKEYSETYVRKNKDPVSKKIDTTDWNTTEWLIEQRHYFADLCNKYLELEGYDLRVSADSYKAQGVEQVPGVHLGTVAAEMERKQPGSTELGRINMSIANRNKAIKEINRLLDDDEIAMTSHDVAAAKQMKKEILENEDSGAMIIGPQGYDFLEVVVRALDHARQLFFAYVDKDENCFIVFLKSAAETISKIIDKAVSGLEGVLSTAEEKSKETDNQKDEKPADFSL